METEIIGQGWNLMLFGMGTVFAFLTILVFFTTFMSYIVNRYFAVEAEPQPRSVAPVSAAAVDAKTLKIIQDAIEQHRAKTN